MAQEHKVTMTCLILGKLCDFLPMTSTLNGWLKPASRYRPIAIGPEWFIVRHHFVTGR